MTSAVDAAMAALRQPGRAIPDAMANTPDVPGLYSVHACPEGLAQLGLASHQPSAPIYVGLATKSLRKRDTRQHFASTATGGSTVRRSCAALLADDLHLTPVPRGARSPRSKWRLADKAQEACLTEWMRAHLTLTIWPSPADVNLEATETLIIRVWHPPMNLSKDPVKWVHLQQRREAMASLAGPTC
ncbi:GIY-YIG nuclease family protein [Luteococcus sp. Sow4_B9]|uniref:GIY-YIG nuclease family protein n=1 Tax=Luteococcus sp. Sow4_B9 TaxID=3438792 RepID=UPI003F9BF15F